jgi:hypothetical protein
MTDIYEDARRYDALAGQHFGSHDFDCWFPQELDALLNHNGFAIEHKFGDYDLSPFTSASRHQLLVAKRA